MVWIMPPAAQNGDSFRALFTDPSEWAETRRAVDGLGYADHWLNSQFSDAELRAWLPQIARWGMRFGLEVGAVKPWGPTGEQAFAHDSKMWDRFIADGGRIDQVAMDEPLKTSLRQLHQDFDYAVEQTARFVALVRQRYPGIRIGDIEPYPGIPVEQLLAFVDAVQRRLAQWHVRGLDFFRVDVDWMHFRPGDPFEAPGWEGVRALEAGCHQRGLRFSLIYWAADVPAMRRRGLLTESTWEQGILQEGAAYQATGAVPDEMVIESWVSAPDRSVPETEPGTFTHSVLDFLARFDPGAGR